MDDEIIHSWCFHDVECFDSTPSAAIIILDKDLESFSSLRSQQHPRRASEEKHHFIAFVGSLSDDRDQLEGPPIMINPDLYNSLDGQLGLISI